MPNNRLNWKPVFLETGNPETGNPSSWKADAEVGIGMKRGDSKI